MPTKFVVLWLQTIFIEPSAENGREQFNLTTNCCESETVLQSETFSSLEESWQFYNKKAADDTVQQVMILVPLKDFNRITK